MKRKKGIFQQFASELKTDVGRIKQSVREIDKKFETDVGRIRLSIREIDEQLDVIMGLGVVQEKWRLDKRRKRLERDLRQSSY